jgi:hypothetical protein
MRLEITMLAMLIIAMLGLPDSETQLASKH